MYLGGCITFLNASVYRNRPLHAPLVFCDGYFCQEVQQLSVETDGDSANINYGEENLVYKGILRFPYLYTYIICG